MDTAFHLLPPEASAFAPKFDALFALWGSIAFGFGFLIFVLVVFFGLYYRRRDPNERPAYVHEPILLEIAWTVIPFGTIMILFVAGTILYFHAQQPPANAETIYVIGKQWMWKIQHEDGRREINEMHVPVGKPIVLSMTSQDVIHDFGLPAFRLKRDVIPGVYTYEWFVATTPGEYHIFCDQYCGAEHANMIGKVVVMAPEKYAEWLSGTTPDLSPRAAGAALYQSYGCSQCHGVRAPTLAGLYGTKVDLDGGRSVIADEDYIRRSILEPSADIVKGYPDIMPTFKGQMSDEEVMELVAYIKSLAGANSVSPYQGAVTGGPSTQPSTTPPYILSVPTLPIRQQESTPEDNGASNGSAAPANK